jgi:hypothetical protein
MSKVIKGNRYRIDRERYKYYIDKYNWSDHIYIKNITNIISDVFTTTDVEPIGLRCYNIDHTDNTFSYYLPEDCLVSYRYYKLNRVLYE